MELSNIIVSYNTSSLLRDCLESVFKALSFAKLSDQSEVIVVDNASSDDSVSMIQKNFPKVLIIQNKKNFGFAKANNQGMKKSSGEYILLLNSDTEVKNDALGNLLRVIRRDENIAVVGGKLLNPDGSLQFSAGFFPNLSKVFYWMFFLDDLPYLNTLLKPYHIEDKSFYENTAYVDWVSGACFLFRREMIDRIGLLDENIFMYGEELEWCYRIRQAGFKIMYTPNAQILHHKGASSFNGEGGIIEEFKSILYIYKKHYSFRQRSLVRFLLLAGALLRLIIFGIIGRNPRKLAIYAKIFKMVG